MTDVINQVGPVIINAQNSIWEAEYFISINANATYWEGRKDSYEFILNNFRTVGISVSEITKGLEKPDYPDLHGIV